MYVGAEIGAPRADLVQKDCGIIIPGLVNAHTHLELTVMRGLLEGLSFREWLRVLTEVRATVLDHEALLVSSTAGIHEGLLAGITTFADTTATGIPLAAMRTCGVRGIGYVEAFGPDPRVAVKSVAELEEHVRVLKQDDTTLVKTGVSPHAPYTVSADLFRRIGEFARRDSLPVAIHVAESEAETLLIRNGAGPFADGLRERGIGVNAANQSPLQHVAGTGILDGTNALLIHCVRIDEQDARTIANCGATIVHCPISNAKLGHGIAPLGLMLDAGIVMGLGSDSVASNNRMDMLSEARMATLLQSAVRGVPDALSATDALRLATQGGAGVLGLGSTIGTLETGKDADIAMFPINRIESMTGFNPADMLVHAMAGVVAAETVLVAGIERVTNGRVVQDNDALMSRYAAVGEKLRAWRVQRM